MPIDNQSKYAIEVGISLIDMEKRYKLVAIENMANNAKGFLEKELDKFKDTNHTASNRPAENK